MDNLVFVRIQQPARLILHEHRLAPDAINSNTLNISVLV